MIGFSKAFVGQETEDQPQSAQNRAAPDCRVQENAGILSTLTLAGDAETHRHSHDEQEERENQIRGRTAMPLRMLERSADMPPVAGVIDQEHCCNRHSAEDVQGEEARFLILHSAIVQQACKNATDSYFFGNGPIYLT